MIRTTSRGREAGLVALCVAVVAAALALLAVRGPVFETRIAYAFVAGQTRSYDLSMAVSVGRPPEAVASFGQDFRVSGRLDVAVVEVHPDGSATIEIRTSMGAAGVGQQTDRLRVRPDGTLVPPPGGSPGPFALFATSGPQPAVLAPTGGLLPHLPSGAVAPGDTWQSSQEIRLPGGVRRTVDVRGRVERFQDTPFGRAARVVEHVTTPDELSVTLPGPPGSEEPAGTFEYLMRVESESVSLISLDSPELIRMDLTMGIATTTKATGVARSPLGNLSFEGSARLSLKRVDRTSAHGDSRRGDVA